MRFRVPSDKLYTNLVTTVIYKNYANNCNYLVIKYIFAVFVYGTCACYMSVYPIYKDHTGNSVSDKDISMRLAGNVWEHEA
jgi:hypothetical protein